MKNRKNKAYNGRDVLKVKLIQGATKAAVHKDHVKHNDKYLARQDISPDDMEEDIVMSKPVDMTDLRRRLLVAHLEGKAIELAPEEAFALLSEKGGFEECDYCHRMIRSPGLICKEHGITVNWVEYSLPEHADTCAWAKQFKKP